MPQVRLGLASAELFSSDENNGWSHELQREAAMCVLKRLRVQAAPARWGSHQRFLLASFVTEDLCPNVPGGPAVAVLITNAVLRVSSCMMIQDDTQDDIHCISQPRAHCIIKC